MKNLTLVFMVSALNNFALGSPTIALPEISNAILEEDSVVTTKPVVSSSSNYIEFNLSGRFTIGTNSCFATGVNADFYTEVQNEVVHVFPVTIRNIKESFEICYMNYNPVFVDLTKAIQLPANTETVILHNVNSPTGTKQLFKF
jgi:hypothetical protein